MSPPFNKITDLTTDKIVWSIRVRAQTVWKGINRKTSEFRGFNIIFIDEQSCRIHAFISDKVSDAFAEDLKEGLIYRVSNFKVMKYYGDEQNRCVRNDKHIYFESNTEMKIITQSLPLMKELAFDLFSLKDVPMFIKDDNRFLIDVIGVVNKATVRCISAKDDSSKVHIKFVLSDISTEVNVTFFSEFGQIFYKSLNDCADEQVMVVVASAKVNLYEATKEIYLSNYPATRFYINPKHYSVPMLLESMAVDSQRDEYDSTIYTVKQIKQFNEEYLQKYVLCNVTVKKVDQDCNWYENFHTKCDNEVILTNGSYRCTDCKRNLPCPDKRFKVCTICADETGFLPIVFPDDEIQRITGKDVYEVENDNREAGDEKKFPSVLKELQNKQFVITLSPTLDNIKKLSNVYVAKRITNPQEVTQSHNPSEPHSPEIVELSNNTEIDSKETLMTYISPPTEKSTNRTRAQKNKKTIKLEMDEGDRSAKVKRS